MSWESKVAELIVAENSKTEIRGNLLSHKIRKQKVLNKKQETKSSKVAQ